MVLNSKKRIKIMAKKAACCFLTSAMLLTGFTVNMLADTTVKVQAATELTYTEENSTYEYTVNRDDTVTITRYSGTDTDIVIPNKIDGKNVTSIGDWAFGNCFSLKSITIPKRVTEIYYGAFDGDTIIYGYSGTAAETYANEKGFEFIELKMVKSEEGIEVEYEKDFIADGTDIRLVTKKLAEGDKEYHNIILEDKILDENVKPENVKLMAFDITLKDGNGTVVQPKVNVTVKMPVPDGYDGSNCKVYRVNANGSFTDMAAACVNGYMVFKTNHFSTYMITETELNVDKQETGNIIYGDANKDGTVNSKDVVMLKKHLAGYKVDIDLTVCDVNGDGTVNSKDVVLVMKKLAGYDVVLGK